METENTPEVKAEKSSFEKKEKSFLHSITFKILIVVPLIFLLLIPKFMITQLIEEREERKQEVTYEIYQKWGGNQTVTGPVMVVPYKKKEVETEVDKDGTTEKIKWYKHFAYFLPEYLDINGTMDPTTRAYGIYEVPVYTSAMKVKGHFAPPDFSKWKIKDENVMWDQSYLVMGISDLGGIQNNIEIKLNDEIYSVSPGMLSQNIAYSGVNADINITGDTTYEFSFDLHLKGTEMISFIPVGKETNVDLSAPWKDPNFDGSFLPDHHAITDSTFTANWNILAVNRHFPQQWKDSESFNLQDAWFGVNLFLPVDHYQQSMRSAKYAIMFIALTFIVFLFVEALNKRQIHAIHYVLVGLALLIFYTLLLSLSEQIGFNLAYLVSAFAIVTMITIYSHGAFKNPKLTLLLGLILVILYGFLFSILQLQDYALLLGSIGLFIVLGIIMWLSRKINWHV